MPGADTRVLRRHDFAFSPGAIVKGLSMTSPHGPSKIERVRAYHELSKHRVDGYAPGPRGLDWATQPDPFRRFEGSPTYELPLDAGSLDLRFSALHRPGAVAPAALGLLQIGLLLQLSLGLSAWKSQGTSRWPLRCNPSSGNLHPTEGYLICPRLDGLDAGVYHYCSRDHLLEQRASVDAPGWSRALGDNLVIGLSAVHWREAWKYGVRAYRYSQHDAGHALAAVRYAAANLGWRAELVQSPDDAEIADLLGVSRAEDFSDAEPEDADLLLSVGPAPDRADVNTLVELIGQARWSGRASRLSSGHREWDAIGEIVRTAHKSRTLPERHRPPALPPLPVPATDPPAAMLQQQRRSAVAFDGRTPIPAATFFNLLDALLPRAGVAPWDALPWAPLVHPALFVHRVEGLDPGLYLLVRDARAEPRLRAALSQDSVWEHPSGSPAHLALYLLQPGDLTGLARLAACHQDIAADSAFSLAMLADFDAAISRGAYRYRQLFWEAGVLGQVLYLEAEAAGLRGTGIGCFFDDAVHSMLGLQDTEWQDIYQFTVGTAVDDPRIQTHPPYAHLWPRGA